MPHESASPTRPARTRIGSEYDPRVSYHAGGKLPTLLQCLQPRPILVAKRDVVLRGQAAWGTGLRREDRRYLLLGSRLDCMPPSMPVRSHFLQATCGGLPASFTLASAALDGFNINT